MEKALYTQPRFGASQSPLRQSADAVLDDLPLSPFRILKRRADHAVSDISDADGIGESHEDSSHPLTARPGLSQTNHSISAAVEEGDSDEDEVPLMKLRGPRPWSPNSTFQLIAKGKTHPANGVRDNISSHCDNNEVYMTEAPQEPSVQTRPRRWWAQKSNAPAAVYALSQQWNPKIIYNYDPELDDETEVDKIKTRRIKRRKKPQEGPGPAGPGFPIEFSTIKISAVREFLSQLLEPIPDRAFLKPVTEIVRYAAKSNVQHAHYFYGRVKAFLKAQAFWDPYSRYNLSKRVNVTTFNMHKTESAVSLLEQAGQFQSGLNCLRMNLWNIDLARKEFDIRESYKLDKKDLERKLVMYKDMKGFSEYDMARMWDSKNNSEASEIKGEGENHGVRPLDLPVMIDSTTISDQILRVFINKGFIDVVQNSQIAALEEILHSAAKSDPGKALQLHELVWGLVYKCNVGSAEGKRIQKDNKKGKKHCATTIKQAQGEGDYYATKVAESNVMLYCLALKCLRFAGWDTVLAESLYRLPNGCLFERMVKQGVMGTGMGAAEAMGRSEWEMAMWYEEMIKWSKA